MGLLTNDVDNKNTDDAYYEDLIREFKVKGIHYTTSLENFLKTNNETNHCDDTKIACEFD